MDMKSESFSNDQTNLDKPIIIPPHTSETIGEPEDSIQNCLYLRPKPPKKDLKTFLQYSGMVGL